MCVIFIKTHVFITDLVSFSEGGGGGGKKNLYIFKMKKIFVFFIFKFYLKPVFI